MANPGESLDPTLSNADMGYTGAMPGDPEQDPRSPSDRETDAIDDRNQAGNRGQYGRPADAAGTSSEQDVVPGISPIYDADPGHQSEGGYGGEDEYDDASAASDDQSGSGQGGRLSKGVTGDSGITTDTGQSGV